MQLISLAINRIIIFGIVLVGEMPENRKKMAGAKGGTSEYILCTD